MNVNLECSMSTANVTLVTSGAKYCHQSVCLSVCPLAYVKIQTSNFANFSVYVTGGHGSVL